MTYAEKLKDPRWQKKRLKILEYARWRCQICGSKSKTLHVHHSYYVRGKEPWKYPDGSLIAACKPCHDKIHPEKRKSPLSQPPQFDEELNKPVEAETLRNRFGSIFAAIERAGQ